MPGTASIFTRKAGTQKSWMTSFDWTVKLTCWPCGTYSCGEAICFPEPSR